MNNADLRYHIASLSAIFLALGIGILIGTAFVGTPIVSRQTGLIRRLETHVGELREETREQERTEEALGRIMPRLIRGTLTGKKVLIIRMGTYADAVTEAARTVTVAGGIPIIVTLPPDNWRARINRPDVTPDTVTMESRSLASRLSAGATELWQSYRDRGQITDGPQSSDDIPPGATRYVILVSGEKDSSEIETLCQQRDLPMIEAWQSAGITVVAVEPLKTAVSYLPTYRNAGIATIDAIDRAAGQITLPFALKGEDAAYGYRPDTERILPPSLEAEPSPTPAATAPPTTLPGVAH